MGTVSLHPAELKTINKSTNFMESSPYELKQQGSEAIM
jgi:hypothetical protein